MREVGLGPELLVGNRYRLVERVGVGAMGTVYRARDERSGREVAVKVIAEHLADEPLPVRRFRQEAELCASLAHPNVVAVLDAGVEPCDFMVMELVRGGDAGTLMRRRREQVTPGQAADIVAQVCKGLAHVHDQDVVHGDVSPGNILIRRSDGTAKLADFGLASGPSGGDPASRVPNVTGTPGYIAPEILGGADPSPLSDLYSLGVVAYRLLSGVPRVRLLDPHATVPLATAAPHLPPLAAIRPDLCRLLAGAVQQALSHDPAARQDSVAQFGAEMVDMHSAPIPLRSARTALAQAA
jgi:serine/threonine protein kinase